MATDDRNRRTRHMEDIGKKIYARIIRPALDGRRSQSQLYSVTEFTDDRVATGARLHAYGKGDGACRLVNQHATNITTCRAGR